MHARAHAVASEVGSATFLHMGHIGSFKILWGHSALLHEGLSARVALEPRNVSHAVWLNRYLCQNLPKMSPNEDIRFCIFGINV